ncbi:hypothetical protein N1851_003883 [Merluccius polli]|uniref:DUF4371 domain-containing protein n=1 Tax=Merluccius polli TaxID=89951 RepID=A0AA47N861_MERPO|nr:hypothetical protein N1851_003883 [Merluccius polli]
MKDGGSGLFMSLLDFNIKKDCSSQKVKTIPKNATYTSHEIQNELISVMSNIVTEAIVNRGSWYTLKVDGIRDPTGTENVSIVIRFFNEDTLAITERLLVMSTSDPGLTTSKIFSQVYDGAAVMSGKHGGLLQEKEGREIPYVHFKKKYSLVWWGAVSVNCFLTTIHEIL